MRRYNPFLNAGDRMSGPGTVYPSATLAVSRPSPGKSGCGGEAQVQTICDQVRDVDVKALKVRRSSHVVARQRRSLRMLCRRGRRKGVYRQRLRKAKARRGADDCQLPFPGLVDTQKYHTEIGDWPETRRSTAETGVDGVAAALANVDRRWDGTHRCLEVISPYKVS